MEPQQLPEVRTLLCEAAWLLRAGHSGLEGSFLLQV